MGCASTADDTPDSHETALKGAITDGAKRALRAFGPQFALSLYDRERSPEHDEAATRRNLQAALFSLGAQRGMNTATVRERAEKRASRPFDQLTIEELARLVRLLADRPARQQKRPAA